MSLSYGQNLPSIILVRPQLGENIGAAARAMYNFGLQDLRLVAPRDGWPNDKAGAMAAAAGIVIDNARLFGKTQDAIADLTYTYALTARPRELIKTVSTPEEAVRDAIHRLSSQQKVGFIFGPERSGLENADIALANEIVTVPVNDQCPSINLAQCVMLIAYEWQRQQSSDAPKPEGSNPDYAPMGDVHKLTDFIIAELETRDFFRPAEKKQSMQESFRNMMSRTPMTQKDLQTVWGALRTLLGKFQKH